MEETYLRLSKENLSGLRSPKRLPQRDMLGSQVAGSSLPIEKDVLAAHALLKQERAGGLREEHEGFLGWVTVCSEDCTIAADLV